MRKLEHFWAALESVPTLTQPIRLWEEMLGPDFDFGQQFLRSTGRLAEWLPCPIPGRLSCARRVLEARDGGFIALCGNEPKGCDLVAVHRESLVLHEIRVERLARVISRALDLEANYEPHPSVPGAWILGRHRPAGGGEAAVVCLIIPDPSEELRSAVVETLSATDGPLIITSPTTQGHDFRTQQLLARGGHGLIALENLLALEGCVLSSRARLEAVRLVRETQSPPANVFRPHGPMWQGAFGGRPVLPLMPQVGAFYIWEILKSRPSSIPAVQLYGRRPDLPNDLPLGSTGKVAEEVDKEVLGACRRQLRSLRSQLGQSGVQDEPIRRAELERQVLEIESYVTAATGLGGRIRLSSNDPKKIANAISEALRRTYEAITKADHRDLAVHFRRCIRRRDGGFSYHTVPDTAWQTK